MTLEDTVALSLWFGAPRRLLLSWLRQYGSETSLEAALDACRDLTGHHTPSASRLRVQARRTLANAAAHDIRPLTLDGPSYPRLLACIPDPPLVLWVQGEDVSLGGPAVAVVGSRYPSSYGLEAAGRLAADLVRAGAIVVSGLARGIDSAAHRAALDAGGRTVAALGCGADVVYPPEHGDLYISIARSGALVTEYPPGTMPQAFHFPARNRIISGLSLAVVVVEAAERSGSLITAGMALEQGREVMAVPGSVFSGRHRGCHALIRDGAAVVESADDVLAAISGSPLRLIGEVQTTEEVTEDPVLRILARGESVSFDALTARTGLEPRHLLTRLLELELQGTVRRTDGGQFVRVGRTC